MLSCVKQLPQPYFLHEAPFLYDKNIHLHVDRYPFHTDTYTRPVEVLRPLRPSPDQRFVLVHGWLDGPPGLMDGLPPGWTDLTGVFKQNTVSNTFVCNAVSNTFVCNAVSNTFVCNTVSNALNRNTVSNAFDCCQ